MLDMEKDQKDLNTINPSKFSSIYSLFKVTDVE